MKLLITLYLFISTALDQQPQISEVRNLYKNAAEEEAAAEKLLEFTEDKTSANPLVLGYNGAAHMMVAKHVGNPFKKLSYFNKGKEIFTKAIEAAPDNVELRFLRFAVQAETPAFLNYKQDLEEDKEILLAKVPGLKDAELKRMILKYLSTSKGLSDAEKEKL